MNGDVLARQSETGVLPPNRFFGWVKDLFEDIATPTPAHTASDGFSGWVKELVEDITNPIGDPKMSNRPPMR